MCIINFHSKWRLYNRTWCHFFNRMMIVMIEASSEKQIGIRLNFTNFSGGIFEGKPTGTNPVVFNLDSKDFIAGIPSYDHDVCNV